jgi:hypothetical protein
MPQTVNGQDTSEQQPEKDNRPAALRTRPGQRQRERMQRLARRRKRQRIISASIAAFLLIVLGVAGDIFYQNYSAQQETLHAHATGTADAHVTATTVAHANATGTVTSKNCFLSPNGQAVPSVYQGAPTSGPTTAPVLKGTATTLKGGLKYVDIKVGTGSVLTTGKTITANYTGWLASTCQKFDSSFDAHSGTPATTLSIQLATGSLIPGWIQGLPGMKVGGIRRLYIPSALGYGSQAAGSIPANSDLIFDVQLISFK